MARYKMECPLEELMGTPVGDCDTKSDRCITDSREPHSSMSEEMMRDRVEMTVDIYESADSVRDHDFTTKTNTNKPPPHQQTDEWIYYQFSFYYMSNETKNWTESRQDCLKKGADLIIINNSEEQDFVKNNTANREFWIGVTDSDVEGIWKWVDGSNLTSGFWASNEPNGRTIENCAVTYLTQWPKLIGWLDVKCNKDYQWICEKSILPLIRK
ncbi:hypothetical protein cypCar_00038058 [Cyprinus carpio]|nr:hypothetical protein cypCar_00038058 [Cyprinus carpio]